MSAAFGITLHINGFLTMNSQFLLVDSHYEFAILVGRFTKGVPIVSATTHSFIVISDSHLLALRFSFQFTHGAGQHVSMWASWAVAFFKNINLLRQSIQSGKDSTSTLSLVIHRLRFQKKCTLAFKMRGETQETIKFWWSPDSVFRFFPERLHWFHLDFHCSYYLYSYCNSSRILCIKSNLVH
jgi:hypothetical protein